MRRLYLGVACTAHDPSIALVDERGELIYAQATERDRQYKRAWYTSPVSSHRLQRMLAEHLRSDGEVVVAYSWQLNGGLASPAQFFADLEGLPQLDEFGALLLGTLSNRAISYLQVRDICTSGGIGRRNDRGGRVPALRCYDHHLTHAIYGCYASGLDNAVCAVIDGFGEAESTAFYSWREGVLTSLERPVSSEVAGSLGLFYWRLCNACGFDGTGGEEWKVMGLSAYGKFDPHLYALLRPMMTVRDLQVIRDHEDEDAQWASIQQAIGSSRSSLHYADLAHTGQRVFEEVAGELLSNLYRTGASEHLVLTGGCALNSLWNGKISSRTGFKTVFVPPAPADDGNAVGAAWAAFRHDHPTWRPSTAWHSPYLGDTLDEWSLGNVVKYSGLKSRNFVADDVCLYAAQLIEAGKIIAWVQGRAEFGPRALGNRSILADARRADMKQIINDRVKFREEFRPFAPSVLRERAHEFFDDYADSPYMERALPIKAGMRERIPAVVHVDGTGRLQTVSKSANPRFHRLIEEFERLTGTPVVLNTSFNVMGKPIVHSVEDAVAVFMSSGLDALVIGDTVFEK